jgi:hypothetical protein
MISEVFTGINSLNQFQVRFLEVFRAWLDQDLSQKRRWPIATDRNDANVGNTGSTESAARVGRVAFAGQTRRLLLGQYGVLPWQF